LFEIVGQSPYFRKRFADQPLQFQDGGAVVTQRLKSASRHKYSRTKISLITLIHIYLQIQLNTNEIIRLIQISAD